MYYIGMSGKVYERYILCVLALETQETDGVIRLGKTGNDVRNFICLRICHSSAIVKHISANKGDRLSRFLFSA